MRVFAASVGEWHACCSITSCGKRSVAIKIAIPTFGTRVSPRFDCAQVLLVVTVDDGKPSAREELATPDWAPHERINKLLQLGVDTVICGGIDRWSVESLRSAGVTIYGWVAGEVDDALAALLRGDLDSEAATEARGRCGCRRFPADDGTRRQPGFGRAIRRRAGRGRGHGRGRESPGP